MNSGDPSGSDGSDGSLARFIPGTFQWFMYDQFVNYGAIQVGSAAASGNAVISMSTVNPATLTNRGSIAVQNGSLFKLQPITAAGTFVNTAGAVLSISSGSLLASGSYYGYSDSGIGNLNITNHGMIEVTGAPGRNTGATFEGSYQGSGVLSIRGGAGAAASGARREISGAASGVFDVASGQLYFHTTPVGGGVNFLDNNG